MSTTIDIIDTAVKIGLGALITGISTYLVTTKIHKHEVKKNLVEGRKELVMDVARKVEKASSIRFAVVESIFQKARRNIEDTGEDRQELLNAMNELREAMTNCYLIGEEDLACLVDENIKLLSELKSHYAVHGIQYELSYVDENTTKHYQLKRKIWSKYKDVFDGIYA